MVWLYAFEPKIWPPGLPRGGRVVKVYLISPWPKVLILKVWSRSDTSFRSDLPRARKRSKHTNGKQSTTLCVAECKRASISTYCWRIRRLEKDSDLPVVLVECMEDASRHISDWMSIDDTGASTPVAQSTISSSTSNEKQQGHLVRYCATWHTALPADELCLAVEFRKDRDKETERQMDEQHRCTMPPPREKGLCNNRLTAAIINQTNYVTCTQWVKTMLTDFQNYFTSGLSSERVMKATIWTKCVT